MAGPTYTYTADVPQGATPFSQTQSPILNNFRAINELVNVNHVGFNNTNTGKHTFLSMPFQADEPSTASSEIALFTQETPSGPNDAEIFYRYQDDGSEYQITDADTSSVNGTLYIPTNFPRTTYYIFPSGFKIMACEYWTGGNTITFPTTGTDFNDPSVNTVALPPFINAPLVTAQAVNNGSQGAFTMVAYNVTQSGFKFTGPTVYVSFIAMGF